jgi:hypothetical protein
MPTDRIITRDRIAAVLAARLAQLTADRAALAQFCANLGCPR